MKKFLFIYGFLILHTVNAQHFTVPDTLQVNLLGQQLGLLQLNVKEMAFDDLGYLWAGTEDGLYRFNGYTFKAYLHNPDDVTSIKDDHVRSLLFDDHTLWIATNSSGFVGFIPSENKFTQPFIFPEDSELNIAYRILKLDDKTLLFSCKNHMIIYNTLSKDSEFLALPKTIKENHITDVLPLENNRYLMATTASGILEFNSKTLRIEQNKNISNLNIQCLYRKGDQVFIGTDKGLLLYNGVSEQLLTTQLTAFIKYFYTLDQNRFYIATQMGLFLFNTEDFSITPVVFRTVKNSLYKVIDINQITGDDQGNLWFGTEARGLFHHNIYQKKFNSFDLTLKQYPHLKNISAFQFLKEKDSMLWIGSKYGVVKYAHLTSQFKLYKNTEGQLIYTLIRDQNNTVWAGGFTTGLLKYNQRTDRFHRITGGKQGLQDDDVIEIIPVDENTLWVCTWSGGIHQFDIKKEEFKEVLLNNKSINRARTSLVDSKGNIWLGTDQGAYRVSPGGQVEKYDSHDHDHQKRRLSANRIFSIKEDPDGNIWFGSNAGLTKLDVKNDETTLYYKQDGLPNDFIYAVLMGRDHNIWLSSNYGISVLNTTTNRFTSYTAGDGLQNNEFNGKAGYRDAYGNFYFGGISGINIFNPKQIKESPFLPEVHVESVELFNKPLQKNILYKDDLQFKSDENVITLNFSALNFLNPDKINYTFKMEGFDEDWRPVSKSRSTTYTNLDPGNYTFKVKASNDSNMWSETPKTLNIKIIPPWYKTRSFTVFLALFFLISGPVFYFYRVSKLKKDKLRLEQLVDERTEEITLRNSDLYLANREVEKQNKKITFLMKELSHRVKNNLQIISSLLNIQAQSLEHRPAAEALKVARNRILAITHLENSKAQEGEKVRIDSFIKNLTNNIIAVLADDEQLKFKIKYDLCKDTLKDVNLTLLGLILNELITNTIKYAFDTYDEKNELKISCKKGKSALTLIVSDNGKGYDPDKEAAKKSLGLGLVHEMVSQLNGSMKIISGKGTKNTITISV